jgi:16S rRNA (adenine1518-N6/adenine1519-N6)-dimethyltransferase
MDRVKAKKYLGQHFLNEPAIAQKIAQSLTLHHTTILEVGPGMGILTRYLLQNKQADIWVVEIDPESVKYLKNNFSSLENKIIEDDFLKLELSSFFKGKPFALIGNYPYNISSQIVFKMLENKELITEMVGMFQKEVAERICAKPGNKDYGILSVLTQAYYQTEYLFTVDANKFNPPPKVKSGVVRLIRKNETSLGCNERLFKELVKQSFNQRRKMLRNSLKTIGFNEEELQMPIFSKRPEQLTLTEFVYLTNLLNKNLHV